MPLPIEDYAFLSDLESSCLVGKDGSIDWLTFPRFDSPACFAALLGDPEHGRWLLAPEGGERAIKRVERRYQDDSMVLETVFTTDEGEVAVIDCMPPRDRHLEVVRLVEGRRGRVRMTTELVIRFDYGSIVPWVKRNGSDLVAVAGPEAVYLDCAVPTRGESLTTRADFVVHAGDVETFVLTWHPSHLARPAVVDAVAPLADTHPGWREW
jgi:GH15 family glucan-1,4-alpha-glucosidase